MTWEITWADMCRACMEVDGDLLPLYSENETDKNLADKLADIGSIELRKDDGLPTKLCAKCISKLAEFLEFRNVIQESDSKFRSMFNQQVVSDAEVDREYDQAEFHDSSLDKEQINSPTGPHNFQETEILQTTQENSEALAITDPINSCDTIVLRVRGDLDNAPEIHLVIESADLSGVENKNQPRKNNDSELEELMDLSSTFVLENSNVDGCADRKTLSETNSESKEEIKTSIETKKVVKQSNEDDSSDDDGFGNQPDDIVGSLNDEITRVKEIKVDGKVKEFKCTLCNLNYNELADAVSHVVDLHVPKSGPFFCLVCEKDCDSLKQLKAHVKIHKWPYPYICFLCNKAYVMKRYLKRHMICHTDFPRYRCSKCGIRFKVKDELDKHINTHKEQQVFKCDQCERVFNHKGNYKRHLICHLDPNGILLPKFPCTFCNRRFLNNRSLTIHMRTHTGEKPYMCDTCGKSFSQHGNLMNHERIHSNPRNFTCNTCGKKFNQKATLKDHSLIHSGEKPYVCNVCGLAFTFSAALRRHLWNHNGKPYECSVCKAKFTGKYDLKRHMGSHKHSSKSSQNRIKKNKQLLVIEDSEHQVDDIAEDYNDVNTIFVEQIFLKENCVNDTSDENPGKENVEMIFGLI